MWIPTKFFRPGSVSIREWEKKKETSYITTTMTTFFSKGSQKKTPEIEEEMSDDLKHSVNHIFPPMSPSWPKSLPKAMDFLLCLLHPSGSSTVTSWAKFSPVSWTEWSGAGMTLLQQSVPGGPGPASPIWSGLLPPTRLALQFLQRITGAQASGLCSPCSVWSSFPFL